MIDEREKHYLQGMYNLQKRLQPRLDERYNPKILPKMFSRQNLPQLIPYNPQLPRRSMSGLLRLPVNQ